MSKIKILFNAYFNYKKNSNKILLSFLILNDYESNVTYIDSKSKDKAGMATNQQPFLVILSTIKENRYTQYIKLCPIPVDNQNYNKNFISKRVILSKERKLNTDGKATYATLKDRITLQSEKIIYD